MTVGGHLTGAIPGIHNNLGILNDDLPVVDGMVRGNHHAIDSSEMFTRDGDQLLD